MLSVKQGRIYYHFWVFGMTRPGIEPRLPRPLANTQLIRPIAAGIVNQTIIGAFKVGEDVRPNSANYCDFKEKTFFAWYKSPSRSFKVKCVSMHDNAPSHVSKLTHEFFEHKRSTGEKIMERLSLSPDVNLIENLS